jgi:predicted dehydrogenase
VPLPAANHYTRQWQAFSSAIRHGTPFQNDMQAAVTNMRVIEAIFRAAASERWEKP